MASKYWIKLYHEMLHDPKMGRMSDHLYRRCIEVFLLAGEHGDSGALPSIEDMAWTLRADTGSLAQDLAELSLAGIVGEQDGVWTVTHFATRQAHVPAAERMAKMRERNDKDEYYSDNPSYGSVTNRNIEDNEPVTIRNTDIDIDIDIDKIRIESTPNGVSPEEIPFSDPPEKREDQRMWDALLELCHIKRITDKSRGQTNKLIKWLRDNSYGEQDIRAFHCWWESDEWRKEHQLMNLTLFDDKFGAWVDLGKPSVAKQPRASPKPQFHRDKNGVIIMPSRGVP